jgi:cephalosporin hydroxylase
MDNKKIRAIYKKLVKPYKHFTEVIMQNVAAISNVIEITIKRNTSQEQVIFVEIGVHMGGSFFFIGECFRQAGKEVLGIGIDIFDQKYHKTTKMLPDKAVAALQPLFPYILIEGDSHKEATLKKLKQYLNNKKVDFLFIDGDHTPAGCMQDYKMYGPLVRKGGLIAFDDINNRPKEAWQEIKKQTKNCQGFGGIGIVYVEKE